MHCNQFAEGKEKEDKEEAKKSARIFPAFEGEFIKMFPINRLSILEGFRSNLRHVFSTRQKAWLTGYCWITCGADQFPRIIFCIAVTWCPFWPIRVSVNMCFFAVFWPAGLLKNPLTPPCKPF